MADIDLSKLPTAIAVPTARVWVKSKWGGDFVHRPDFSVLQTVESLAPELPTATLQYRYGRVKIPDKTQYQNYPPVETWGFYVLIEWMVIVDGNVQRRWWLGASDPPVTSPIRAAAGDVPASGVQTIPCFGLERVLQIHRVTETVFTGGDGNEPIRRQVGSVFNDTVKGNRSEENDGDTFAKVRADAKPWSSRDIFKHLVNHHLPQPLGGTELPWDLGTITPIPDWDSPRIETENRTLFELIDEVLAPDRLLGWYVRPSVSFTGEAPVVDDLFITPVTRTPTDVNLPGIGNLPANTRTHTLIAASDPLCQVQVVADASELVNQVVVEGAREIGICTLTKDDIVKGWKTDDENTYSDGAKDELDWDDWQQFERRTANERVREKPELVDVYRSFKLPDDWNGKADDSDHVFIKDEPTEENEEPKVHQPNMRAIELLESLPLYREVDYEGDVEDVDEAKGETFRQIAFYIERDDATFEPLEKLGEIANGTAARSKRVNYTIEASPDNVNGPGYRVTVSGGPNHAITAMVGNHADVDQDTFGGYHYNDIIVTTAIMGDRRPFYAYPTNDNIKPLDIVRRRVIRIEHHATTHVHIAAATVVGLDANGDKITSDGGVLRDPADVLQALCTLASQSLVTAAMRVQLVTPRLLADMRVGDVFEKVDGETTGSPVLEIRIDAKASEGNQADASVVTTLTAAASRVDLLRLLASENE
ncbi:MAG: hypothetical protein WBD31_13645 [Rubripirellula sp.]